MAPAKRPAKGRQARKGTKKGKEPRPDLVKVDASAPLTDNAAPAAGVSLRLRSGEPIGVLYLDRGVVETAMLRHFKDSDLGDFSWPKQVWPALVDYSVNTMLPGLAHQFERLVEVAVSTAPIMWPGPQATGHPEYSHRYCDLLLSVLEDLASRFEDRSSGVLAELPGQPFTRFVKRHVETNGTGQQRHHLQKILRRVARGKGGRPPEELDKRSDVRLVRIVDHFRKDLASVFHRLQEHKKQTRRGRNEADESIQAELRQKHYKESDITLISESRNAHSAACKLVASWLHMKPDNVKAAVSRGRRLIRETPSRKLR